MNYEEAQKNKTRREHAAMYELMTGVECLEVTTPTGSGLWQGGKRTIKAAGFEIYCLNR